MRMTTLPPRAPLVAVRAISWLTARRATARDSECVPIARVTAPRRALPVRGRAVSSVRPAADRAVACVMPATVPARATAATAMVAATPPPSMVNRPAAAVADVATRPALTATVAVTISVPRARGRASATAGRAEGVAPRSAPSATDGHRDVATYATANVSSVRNVPIATAQARRKNRNVLYGGGTKNPGLTPWAIVCRPYRA